MVWHVLVPDALFAVVIVITTVSDVTTMPSYQVQWVAQHVPHTEHSHRALTPRNTLVPTLAGEVRASLPEADRQDPPCQHVQRQG